MSDHSPAQPEMKAPLVTTMLPDEPAAAVAQAPTNELAAAAAQAPTNESSAHIAIVPDPASSPEKDEMLAEFWVTVKRLPRYVRLAALMARDPQVPKSSKALLAAGTAYTVTPIDFVPGIIPVAGQLDDLYVLLSALRQAIRTCPDDVVRKHLTATDTSVEVIDADLALVRKLVRRGLAWTIRNGRKAVTGATRYVSARIREQRAESSRGGS